MIFTNIPKNGASWSEELPYSFATELAEPSDVSVEVRDADSDELLGTMRLYSVTRATIDIAPIVRRAVSMSPATVKAPSIIASLAVRRVVVVANGVASSAVSLFRAPYTPTEFGVLSSMSTANGIASGDVLRFTLNIVGGVRVRVVEYSTEGKRDIAVLAYSADERVVEVVVPIGELSPTADRVELMIVSGATTASWEYRVRERTSGSRTLLWYNVRGGIESYAFPYCPLVSRTADVVATPTRLGNIAYLSSARSRVRLTSALLSRSEQERLSEILLSPNIFEDCGGRVSRVELSQRELRYDDHGAFERLSLDIDEEWKGGALL